MNNWFKIFNQTEFLNTGLTSRTLNVDLEGFGSVTIQISLGNFVSILYDDEFLPVNFLEKNPYVQGNCAVYIDTNADVWLGIDE